MKFKNKLAFILFLPFCLGAGPNVKIPFYLISPKPLYNVLGDRTVPFDVVIMSDTGGTCYFEGMLYNHKTGVLQYSCSYTEDIPKKGKIITLYYPLRYRLTSDGLRFTFTLKYGSATRVLTAVLYPLTPIEINANQYRNTTYTVDNRFFKIEMKGIVSSESYSFNNFNEYISKNIDNSIDFSTVYFNYLRNYKFIYTKAEFHIKDYNNVYPHLPKSDGEIILDMTCQDNNGEISFALDEEMYVNTSTLEMFTMNAGSLAKTNKLFIPVGKEHLLEGDECYILLKGAGYSLIDIKLPLSFYFSKKIIGQCFDSDYCIKGGVKE